MLNKIRFILKMSIKNQILVILTFLLTGIFRASILLFSFKRIAKIMGEQGKETSFEYDELNDMYLKKIQWMVIKVSKNTKWESLCLVQALTALTLLKLKKINATIYLGLLKDNGELLAHAWLRSGDFIVIGGEQKDKFTVIETFASIY